MAIAPEAPAPSGLRQLRHDLLNPLNVLVGATGALLDTELTDLQRAWVRMIQNTTARLQDIIDRIEAYQDNSVADGQARLADLCSIAAARVGKPFDRQRLVQTIRHVAGPHARLRVLLVDDSPELAMLVRTYLSETNWELDVVDTGERAVAQATTERYDVVLMDIDLPGLDGATAAHAIRAADLARGTSPTPVIAMTAFDPGTPDISSATEPLDAAADDDVVTIDDAEIAPLVPEFLENRRAEVLMYRQALTSGEYASIQSAAHKMKGTGRGYGFSVISRIGGDLEYAAHRHDVGAMTRLIDELDGYLRRVKIDS